MIHFKNKKHFANSQIQCRFLKPLEESEPLLLTVPGGPSLPSDYLDSFLNEVSEMNEVNVGIIELPNFNYSLLENKHQELYFPDYTQLITETILEISQQVKSIIFYGHSFGARILAEAIPSIENKNVFILSGFPYQFSISSTLMKKLQSLELEAEVEPDLTAKRKRNWKKILPLYTTQTLSESVFQSLSLICHQYTYNAYQHVPDINNLTDSIDEITQKRMHILVAEGDIVVPDDNWKKLGHLFPHAKTHTLKEVGHFPTEENRNALLELFNFILKEQNS